MLNNKKLEPFICHIRFPQYKNLAPDTKIEFSYPISVLVGANGTNKSSVLRALYGAPEHNNLGTLWFSTSIDPIDETGEAPSCFIYGYWNAAENIVVEVIKSRVKKEGDPDYWEPSRPLLRYGMAKLPPMAEESVSGRSRTRWNAIEKTVVYIDFRGALSAFDKFFYHGELRSKPSTEKNKKDFIRTRSPHLKLALSLGATTYKYFRKERIVKKENRTLTAQEVRIISTILGREYSEIKLVRHTFFNCDAYTCLMFVSGLQYTEAFAGSGEFAVVRIVTSVTKAPESSLILLDEPEVSLHPGAQDRLIDFLSESVKNHKHQIIISTHSPSIVRKFPSDALKVLIMNPATGKVEIPKQSALAEEAFFYLGEPLSDRITIIVEDALAKEIVRRALAVSGESVSKLFDIQFFPGGSQTLWGYYLPVFAAENRKNVLVLFDGDQRQSEEFLNPSTISEADEEKLQIEIKRISGVDIAFHVDGGSQGNNDQKKNAMRRNFLSWIKDHVSYLPGTQIPEAFIWDRMKADSITTHITDNDIKVRFEKLTRIELGVADYEPLKSEDILGTQRRGLATIPECHADLTELHERLISFAKSSGLNIVK